MLILLYVPLSDAHDGEGGKRRVCSQARTGAGGRAWRSELDNLAKFACVPRSLVLVSPPSLWICRRELECGCELTLGGADDLLMWVDLYTLCCGGFTQLRRPGVEVEARPLVAVVSGLVGMSSLVQVGCW